MEGPGREATFLAGEGEARPVPATPHRLILVSLRHTVLAAGYPYRALVCGVPQLVERGAWDFSGTRTGWTSLVEKAFGAGRTGADCSVRCPFSWAAATRCSHAGWA